ncbi:MAG: class I tRNA ligase family protein, partial [Verrucomicrobia bacterium]|nr:class I tRNA ligase family protein [Verrucomicrobiota bacterium]
KKWGADILRLWVVSQDFRNDIVVSEERINKVAETYRLLRNTLRYQLSNLYDFDPKQQALAEGHLTGLDRWILGRFGELEQQVAAAYDAYEYHVVYQKLSQFAAVELSAIYHDLVKDRLYTDPANSARRRSTQTALHRMVTSLCKMLAPVLAFTADEAWEFVPGRETDSVHLLEWHPQPVSLNDDEKSIWETFFKYRELILPKLEEKRQEKAIGKALEAKVILTPGADTPKAVLSDRGQFQEILNVSQFVVAAPADAESLKVEHADGQKCERCWHWETEVGSHAVHPTLCGRCVRAVEGASAR